MSDSTRAVVIDGITRPIYERGHYVLGFLFNHMKEVALIRKNRPEWQAGRLNGIGGKVEIGETPRAAMSREFAEEAGLPSIAWTPFGVLKHGPATIYLFRGYVHQAHLVQMTDERVDWYPSEIGRTGSAVHNLAFLIPLARSSREEMVVIEDNTGPF